MTEDAEMNLQEMMCGEHEIQKISGMRFVQFAESEV